MLAYEASVDFIGTLVEINNKIDNEDENAYIAKDLNTKQLRKCQDSVNEATKEIEQDLDKAKYMQKAKRKIWEVYGGNSELTKELRRRGHQARTFGVHNGWDFSKMAIQKKFLDLLDEEQPDDVWMSPECKLWSMMQERGCKTDEEKQKLQQRRADNHKTHLMFCNQICLKQWQGLSLIHI